LAPDLTGESARAHLTYVWDPIRGSMKNSRVGPWPCHTIEETALAESFPRVHWVAVPEALRARRANRNLRPSRLLLEADDGDDGRDTPLSGGGHRGPAAAAAAAAAPAAAPTPGAAPGQGSSQVVAEQEQEEEAVEEAERDPYAELLELGAPPPVVDSDSVAPGQQQVAGGGGGGGDLSLRVAAFDWSCSAVDGGGGDGGGGGGDGPRPRRRSLRRASQMLEHMEGDLRRLTEEVDAASPQQRAEAAGVEGE
jgi:hypothetical protein